MPNAEPFDEGRTPRLHTPEERLANLIREELTEAFARRKEELRRIDKRTGDGAGAFFDAMHELAHNLEQSVQRIRTLANMYAEAKLREAGD